MPENSYLHFPAAYPAREQLKPTQMSFLFRMLAVFLLGTGMLAAQPGTDQDIRQAEERLDKVRREEAETLEQLEAFKLKRVREDLRSYGLPATSSSEEVIFHSAMALVYSELHEQAKWVAHIITTDVAEGSVGRSNDFRPDPFIKTGSAVEADYFIRVRQPDGKYKYEGFGYDRGHLAPSADFRWSATALSESYYYSNMSPQVPEFNRVCWAKLENLLRAYVDKNTTNIYVVTGPVLTDTLRRIERAVNRPSIPDWYYKAVVDRQNGQAIAFLMPNRRCEYPVEQYAVTIDSLERLTGLDFFPALPEGEEERLEAMKNVKAWLSTGEQSDVLPLDPVSLPRNHFNTTQAKFYEGKNDRVCVCGTVVGSKRSAKENVFLNLDKAFPNQVFTVTIFNKSGANFSYRPEDELLGKTICVEGKVTGYNGVPSMIVENEKAIRLYRAD